MGDYSQQGATTTLKKARYLSWHLSHKLAHCQCLWVCLSLVGGKKPAASPQSLTVFFARVSKRLSLSPLPHSVAMEAGFDKLDAAGFLEIWQHFDADGEDGHFFWSCCTFWPLVENLHLLSSQSVINASKLKLKLKLTCFLNAIWTLKFLTSAQWCFMVNYIIVILCYYSFLTVAQLTLMSELISNCVWLCEC